MTIYYIIYLLPLIGILLESINVKNFINIYVLVFTAFIFIIFRGLRWDTGTDWEQFYMCFENANLDNIFSYSRYDDGGETMEPGYMLLNVIIKFFGDYTLFLVLTNLFIIGSWVYFSYKIIPFRSNMIFAMTLATNLIFPVRLQLAACILSWSFFYLSRKRFLLPIAISVIAYTIHKSALFVIPIVFLIGLKKHIGGKFAFIMTCISFIGDAFASYIPIIILFILPYLPKNLQGNILTYSNCEMEWGSEKSFLSLFLGMGLNMAIVILFIYTRSLFTIKEPRSKYIFDIYFFTYVLWTFFFRFFSSPSLEHFSRISEYFTLGFSVCFVLSLYKFEQKKIVSSNVTTALFLFYYLYKINNLISATPFPKAFFPYKSIFF